MDCLKKPRKFRALIAHDSLPSRNIRTEYLNKSKIGEITMSR